MRAEGETSAVIQPPAGVKGVKVTFQSRESFRPVAFLLALVGSVGLIASCSGIGGGGSGGGGGGGIGNGGGNNPPSPVTSVLATNINAPINIVVDNSAVYWIDNNGSIGTVDLTGNSAQLLAAATTCTGFDLTQDVAFIYFSLTQCGTGPAGSINKVPKTGGSVTDLADSSNTTFPGCDRGTLGDLCGIDPSGIATNGMGQLFFGDHRGILEVSTQGGNPVPVYNQGSLGPAYTISVGTAEVFFVEWGLPSSAISEVPFAGGTPTAPLISSLDTVFGIVTPTSGTGNTGVFWIEAGTTDSVGQSVPAGKSAQRLVGGVLASTSARALAVDSSNIYFPEGNQIAKVPIGGGQTTILASVADSNGVAGIAVPTNPADNCVYWASTGSGPGQGSIRKACPR